MQMIDVVLALQEALNKSAASKVHDWLGRLPRNAAWHLVSDYVFCNPDRHDTASFVMLLHHDKLESILEYISIHAPADMKQSRYASEGLISYLNSPVVFSFTFVLDDGDDFLKTYASVPRMIEGLQDLSQAADTVFSSLKDKDPCFSQVKLRLGQFVRDLERKGNAKLARQVLLVATFAAIVLDHLDKSADPTAVSWISDRDAILQRHDGVVWDIAALMFYLMKCQRSLPDAQGKLVLNGPRLVHVSPNESGKNYLDPLVRMPDYLAAAASDLNLQTFESSHSKFASIVSACFDDDANSVLCSVSWKDQGILARRLARRKAS